MARPFDLSKMKKFIGKSVPGMTYGYRDPVTWIDTGCYMLNYIISNDFRKGIPLEGKFTMFAGDSGSGKSFLATANVIKWCQANNVWPIVIDTENALDSSWMVALGVDTSEDAMDKFSVAAIDDLAKFLGKLIEDYKTAFGDKPYEERQRMVIIIDSLGMLITANQEKQFNEGDQKGDMGIKAKQLTATLRVMLSKIADQPIGLIATNHVFDSQDQYKPDAIPGGKMLEFASSVIIQMNKLLLKEDEDGKEGKEVTGIKASCVVRKSRYAKPFEKLKISIPYDKGMNPYSGLFDLFKAKGLFVQAGSWFTYTSPETGEVFKSQGAFKKEILDQIMAEWSHWDNDNAVGFDETIGVSEDDDA